MSTRSDLYQTITDKIVADLSNGCVPWVQPWGKSRLDPALPKNASTQRSYSGINILLLWGAQIERGFVSQSWLTFRQALDLGGNVRKGEKGTTVYYADRFIPKAEAARAAESGGDAKAVAFLKSFTVFNVAQCDNLPTDATAAAEPVPERAVIPAAEALVTATGAKFHIGGDRAFYVPSEDYVQVPPQPAFFDQINYYRTVAHELTHWTGHGSRLNREYGKRFGDQAYAREELVAEMGAAFVCASLGIVPTVRHADYLGSWLAVLKSDSRAIVTAASHASKAADFLLAFRSQPATGACLGAAA